VWGGTVNKTTIRVIFLQKLLCWCKNDTESTIVARRDHARHQVLLQISELRFGMGRA
jgi:hypothetical protein